MGFFDRRKDTKAGAQPEGHPEAQPEAGTGRPAAPKSGPMPVASEVKEQRIREEPKVAAAPPGQPESPEPPAAEPTAEPGQPEPPPPSAEVPGPAIHTVAEGESLADLADRYGVPAEEIARQNHLAPPGQIHAGQVFVIRP